MTKTAVHPRARASAPAPLGALRRHWPFLVALVAAALVRIAFWVELHPALMFADSWVYLNDTSPLSFLLYRPAGYVFLLAGLRANEHLELVTALQHVAGLLTGVLVYDLCMRLKLPTALSVIAAAIFLFNASTLVLEQYILTESLFALVMVACLRFAILHPRSAVHLALSGFCLALAMLLRAAAVFGVPFWLGWLAIHNRRGIVRLAAPLLALLLPLAAYVGYRNSQIDYGTMALHRGDGWFLYGRAMSFADCASLDLPAATAPLCPDDKPENTPEWFVWSPASPARTFYTEDRPEYNEVVRSVAVQIIREQPLDWIRATLEDVARGYFPGTVADVDASVMIAYEEGQPYPFDVGWPAARAISEKFGLDYRFPRVPADSFVGLYAEHARVPKLALFVAGLLGLLSVARPAWRRREEAWVAVLLSLSAFGMFGFAVATHTYEVRYQVPLVPLYALAGAVGLSVMLRKDPGTPTAATVV